MLWEVATTSSTPDALWASPSARLLRPVAVACRGLRRAVGGELLLDGLDLHVPVGARLLVVSEPEASASLLLRVLAGLARLESGTIRLAGLSRADGSTEGWARLVGYVGAETALYPWLSPREVFELVTRLAAYDSAEARVRSETVIGRFGLVAALDQPLGRLGPALAQRVALAAAMLTDPEILLLDDPLRSADPSERHLFLNIRARRRTVVLASRIPAAEAGLVDQVAFIRRGKLALHAPVRDLEAAGLSLSRRDLASLAEMRNVPAAASAG